MPSTKSMIGGDYLSSIMLVFLGIIVHTEVGELRLPEEKLQLLRNLLREWETKRVCLHRQLESLVGMGARLSGQRGPFFTVSWICSTALKADQRVKA